MSRILENPSMQLVLLAANGDNGAMAQLQRRLHESSQAALAARITERNLRFSAGIAQNAALEANVATRFQED